MLTPVEMFFIGWAFGAATIAIPVFIGSWPLRRPRARAGEKASSTTRRNP